MKKLILSLVFVLATGMSFMNATSNKENSAALEVELVVMDCIAMAFAADEKESLSYEQFTAVVDACEEAQP